MINVGIYVFNGVEILDFAGPYSVLSSVNKFCNKKIFNIFLLSDKNEYITTQNGITVQVNYCFENLETIEILVIPGGSGARNEKEHKQICEYIKNQHSNLRYILSVCTGALILAETGLLHGKSVVTHKNAFDLLKGIDNSITISSTSSVCVNENIVMTAGVLTGIEGALKIIKEVCGNEMMNKVKDNLYYYSNNE